MALVEMQTATVNKLTPDEIRRDNMKTRREFLSAGVALGAASILGGISVGETQVPIAGRTPAGDPLQDVNPEFRRKLQQLLQSDGYVSWNASSLARLRGNHDARPTPVLDNPEIQEKIIPGPVGAPPVRVFVSGIDPNSAKPTILYFHGGGYIAGSAASGTKYIQDLTTALDCVVVAVDYRLAPETRYPGSLEDNYAALRWIYANSKELGVDRARVAILGNSAGGGHAAALAIAARDRGEFPICFQVLIYPMLDDRTGSSRQVPPFMGRFIWTAESNRFGWSSLLGVPAGSTNVPIGAVPARVDNLAGLPPAFIGTGSIDLFAQECITYVQRLILTGVPTEMSVVPGAFHAFDLLVPEAPLSIQFTNSWQKALRRAFTTA